MPATPTPAPAPTAASMIGSASVVPSVASSSSLVASAFPGKVVGAAQAVSLERRLLGLDNGRSADSHDSIESSTVGFREAHGRIGFEHFGRVGQVLTTAVAPAPPVASGSLSPNGAAHHPHSQPKEDIDSQGQTRVLDYNAPPVTLMAGLVAINGTLLSTNTTEGNSALNGSAKPTPAPTPTAASTTSSAATATTVSSASTTASATNAPSSTAAPSSSAPPALVFPPPSPTALASSAPFQLPLSITSPRLKTKVAGKEGSAGHKRKASSPSPKQRKASGAPKTGARASTATAAANNNNTSSNASPEKKKPKLPPTSLVADFTTSTTGRTVAAARKPSERPSSPPPAPAATAPPASPRRPHTTSASTLSPQSHSASGTGAESTPSAPAARARKDITSYFGGSNLTRHASTAHANTNTTSSSTASAMSIDDGEHGAHHGLFINASNNTQNTVLEPDTESDNEVMIIDADTPPPTSTAAAASTSTSLAGKKPRKSRTDKPAAKSRKSGKESASPLPGGVGAPPSVASSPSSASGALAAEQQRLRDLECALVARERACAEREAALESRIQSANLTQSTVTDLETRLTQLQTESDDYRARIGALLQTLFKDLCDFQQRAEHEQLLRDAVTIGRLVPRAGMHLNQGANEDWQDGEAIREANVRIAQLSGEKEEIATAKKKLVSKRQALNRLTAKQQEAKENGLNNATGGTGFMSAAAASSSAAAAAAGSMPPPAARPPRNSIGSMSDLPQLTDGDDEDNGGFKRPAPLDDMQSLFEQDELLSVRMNQVKVLIVEAEAKLRSLQLQRKTLVRMTRLHEDSLQSKFNFHPTLNDRYIVLNMLGKGGFSEVYKAYDLQELRYVACKIHQLNPAWGDARKMNYTRHATREYNIHKSLQHAKVVRLYDVFAIDTNAFCTVLEHCDGSDLDMYLKVKQTLSEREARTIITQVFAGLKYLNEQKQKIIHYDLKPGNILFTDSQKTCVKITDFGLSKITPEGATDGIDLTSQGSGTYWYLPPECFGNSPVITSQVDVWSVGCILYQMLYGRKPFGHGMSAEELLSSRVILDARLTFPKEPGADKKKDQPLTPSQEFIKACLRLSPADRPDILTIFQDKYFTVKMT